ncbi:glycoside hydrolase family 61 protein [Mycena amicta]|nr:glycoside hydrolase family 61 protein [Mycena amicta]
MKLCELWMLVSVSVPTAAHGWVGSIAVSGQLYPGNGLGSSGAPSVIRQVTTNSPVTSVSDSNLACGPNAQLAQDMAIVSPGDEIEIFWVSTEGPWFHNVGPMLTYLANCGSASCAQFDSAQANWFKIQQSGRDSVSNAWVQAALNSGAPANLSLPNVAPGNYLLRHEIIALQNAVYQGGAEFYASCSQISVSGDGSGVPTADELVKLPGAYSATDPSILVDVYTNPSAPYMFPGPPIAAFVEGEPEPSRSASPPTTTANRGASTSTASPIATSCRLKRTAIVQTSRINAAKRWHRALRSFSL